MIKKQNSPVVGVFIGNTPIQKVYLAQYLVWEQPHEEPEEPITEILSCYYNGYWIDEYPWTDDTNWTD